MGFWALGRAAVGLLASGRAASMSFLTIRACSYGLFGLSAAPSLSHILAVAYRKPQLCCWRRPLMVRQP